MAFVLAWGASIGLAQQETDPTPRQEEERGRSRSRQLFSDEQLGTMIDKARADAEARARALREERTLFGDVEGEIIELEPFTVRGDSTRLFADFKRRLEEGSESIQQHAADLAPILAARARMAGRAGEAFFKDRGGHGPMDRGELFIVTNRDAARLGASLLRAIDGLFGSGRRD